MVTEVMRVIEEEYINPFSIDLHKSYLYNLSSGVAVSSELADDIVQIYSKGKDFSRSFIERLVHSEAKFHDPISRNNLRTFRCTTKSCVVEQNKVKTTIEVNCDILADLITFSAKYDKPIDFNFALTVSLISIPLSLSTADERRRETAKSKLNAIST